MKKASYAVLATFIVFICFLIGFFLGRVSTRDQVTAQSIHQREESEIVNQFHTEQNTTNGKIDINSASVHQLQMLPNIGEVLAKRIVEYRNQNGPFSTIDDLLWINGIGEKTLDDLRQYITVGG